MGGPMKPVILCLAVAIGISAAGCSTKKKIESGSISGNIYTSDYFDLSVDLPPGWEVASEETKRHAEEVGGHLVAGKDPAMQGAVESAKKTTYFLLIVSEHSVGTPGVFNSNYNLMAEDVSYAPGIKTGRDYLLNLQQLLPRTQLGAKCDKPPYEYPLGGETFYRLDAELSVAGTTIHQAYVASVRDGYALALILSWHDQSSYQTMEKSIRTLEFK